MKKLFLLLAVGSIAMNGGAQELQKSVVNKDNMAVPVTFPKLDASSYVTQKPEYAKKTTAGGDRWYNYANYIDTLSNYNAINTSGIAPNQFATSAPYMWNDTSSQDAYTGGVTQHNTMVSLGTILDPTWKGFNYGFLYSPGTLAITPSDAYVVDTIIVVGAYGVNAARRAAGVVDTLIVSVVEGKGATRFSADVYSDGGISGTHWGSPTWYDVNYDSTGLNCATNYFGTTHFIARIPMGYGDTLSSGSLVNGYDNVQGAGIGIGSYYKKIGLSSSVPGANPGSGPVSVAAGNLVGITVSFKSGDNTGVGHYAANDVVFNSTSTYNFNMLRPLLTYLGTTTTPDWPILNTGDNNVGLFKTLPDTAHGWDHQYIPEWAWTSANGTAGADLQNPYIWAHITCGACTGVVTNGFLGTNNLPATANSVNAYPNPSTGSLNISFDMAQASDVSVTLSNLLGQVVDSKTVKNTATGKVVFNTTNLPEGVYIYTVLADGNRTTGRVVLAH